MIVRPASRIRATVSVPTDKSISHRSFIFNAIADGKAIIESPLESADVRSTVRCLEALGATISWPEGAGEATILGNGMHGLFEADDVLDCGNSGTTMRLLSGLLAAHPLLSVLTGDASLRGRPMARVLAPLRSMGAHVHGRRGDTLPPLVIRGGDLTAIDYRSPVASAQVKSALLLAGLYAEGETSIGEPARSRDHTERMLAAMGAPIAERDGKITISPPARLQPLSLRVPGDISSAAPWLVLGACHPDAEILITGVNTNPTRTGLLDILQVMGASVELREERSAGGEPTADLLVRSSKLQGTVVEGSVVPRAIDELPLVAVLACFAEGETVVRDAAELRAKESDRVESVVATLGRMGVRVQARDDGFAIHGPAPAIRGARVDAGGDHRIGMLAGILGALAEGDTHVTNGAVEVSYPGFWNDLQRASAGSS